MDPLFKGSMLSVLKVEAPVETMGGHINMTVTFEGLGALPFSASPNDTEDHGRWLYSEALKGTFGEVAPYERPLPTVEDLQQDLDKFMPDILLGLATDQEIEVARLIRTKIKEMTS